MIALAILIALAAQSESRETTVSERRPVDVDDARVSLDHARIAPEDALLGALGASLVHEGGPLAPVRPMVRGLTGARLSVDVGGLPLTDPATGLWDAALLPWAAASSVVVDSGPSSSALGGGLRLELRRDRGLHARFLAGSLSTVRASLAAVGERGMIAVDAGSTRGDFTFQPTSAVADDVSAPGPALTRVNNDHKRGSALARGTMRVGDVDVDAIALAAAHSGGVPGFSTSPTRSLRAEDAVAGARVSATLRTATSAKGIVSVDGRASRRSTFGPDDARSTIESASARGEIALIGLPLVDGALLDVRSGADHSAVLGAAFSRVAADAAVLSRIALGPVRLRVGVDGRATNDVGALFGGEARAELGDDVKFALGVSRRSRAPTLDELYAPRGLVLGNPALRPETLGDVEAALGYAPHARGGVAIDLRAVAFAGFLEDGIAYINKNASEIEPTNIGNGWRAGADLAVIVAPSRWAALDVVGSVLASRVDATGAPLPLAPPLSSRVALRLGDGDALHVKAIARSRGAASSNAFGTLVAAPYTLFDVGASAPVNDALRVGVSVENVLDVTDARDANLLPLPGRLFFVSLEVNP